jgi:hypothetical protein
LHLRTKRWLVLRPHVRPEPAVVHAALMGSLPGHPFWLSVLRALELEVRGLLNWGELTAVDTTGAPPHALLATGAGEDNGIDHNKN